MTFCSELRSRICRPAALIAACLTLSTPSEHASAQAPAQESAAHAEGSSKGEQLELVTKDGVSVHCRYLPSNEGQSATPVILLHGWEGPFGPGRGADLLALGQYLQRVGFAVAIPDLRGHGATQDRQLVTGPSQQLVRDDFKAADIRDMLLDVEAVRSYLVGENNAGRLNLNRLSVVGFEMGAMVALNWAEYDWSVPSFPSLKQGQDVKVCVLVSPPQTFRGVSVRPILANQYVRNNLATLVVVGRSGVGAADSKRIYNSFERSRRPIREPDGTTRYLPSLSLLELDTSLQGSRLLEPKSLRLREQIDQFIRDQFSQEPDLFPWTDRSLTPPKPTP